MSHKSERLVDKVEELASTLYSTTEMLNTADRMVDHYRGINREQEIEISKLRNELQRPQSSPRRKRSKVTIRTAPKQEQSYQRSSHLQMSDDESDVEIELEDFERSLKDLDRKQEKLLLELKRDQKQRSSDMRSIGTTLQKVDDTLLDRKLSEIREQLNSGKSKWEQQQSNLSEISEDLKTLKGLIHDTNSSQKKEKEESLRKMLKERLNEELSTVRKEVTSERQDIVELTNKLEAMQQERHSLTDRLAHLNGECQRKEVLVEKCKNQILELNERLRATEQENGRYTTELEETISRLKAVTRELEHAKQDVKDSEEKRIDVKNRAIEALKEYRSKCRDQEKEKMELKKKADGLEQDLVMLRSENNNLRNNIETLEKRISDINEKAHVSTVECRAELTRVQREVDSLTEELTRKKDLEGRLEDLREKIRGSENEVRSLTRQLEEERNSKATLQRQFEEQFQKIAAEEERLSRQLNEKTVLQQSKYEQETALLTRQLEEERNKVRRQREEHGQEILRVKGDLEKALEQNRKLRRRYQTMRRDLQEKSMEKSTDHRDREDSLKRTNELASELHKNQETLLCTREAYQQTLRNIILQLDNLMDSAFEDSDEFYMKGVRESSYSDTRKMSADIMERIKRCKHAVTALKEEHENNRQHLRKAQQRIQELVQTDNGHKDDITRQLQEQENVIKELAAQKRSLEMRLQDSNEKLQVLSKQLEKSTRVLHAGAEALENKTSLLEELDDLQFEQKERVKISENYVKYKERIGNLQRALEDAKSSLLGLQEDKANIDKYNSSIESFLDNFPRTEKSRKVNVRPKSYVEPLFENHEISISSIEEDESELDKKLPAKNRKERRTTTVKRM